LIKKKQTRYYVEEQLEFAYWHGWCMALSRTKAKWRRIAFGTIKSYLSLNELSSPMNCISVVVML